MVKNKLMKLIKSIYLTVGSIKRVIQVFRLVFVLNKYLYVLCILHVVNFVLLSES